MITDLFQPPMDDLLQHSHDDFRSYPIGFDPNPFEHLDFLYEEDFQPPLCSNFDDEAMTFPEQGFRDENFQPFPFSSCYFTKDTAGNFSPNGDFSVGQECFQLKVCCMDFDRHMKGQQALGWEKRFFSMPGFIPYPLLSSSMGNLRVFLRLFQIPSRSSSDSLVVEDEDRPLSTSFNLVMEWIGKDWDDASLYDFIPPAHLHELDFMIHCDIVSVSTHDILVFDTSLLWFFIKHKVRHFDTMLGWFHGLYDYTYLSSWHVALG
jgi:hypothetical protein